MSKKLITYLSVFALTFAVPVIGYVSFGIVPALIFLSGYLVGFILWTFADNKTPLRNFRTVYWITFALFIIHRAEEKYMGFFDALSEMTKIPKPEIISIPIIALVVISIGGWVAAPFLIRKGNVFGYYFAWTFLASAGISELAHFIFPFFTGKEYGYFPGMWSVLILAPVAWYGMIRMWRNPINNGEV